MEEYIASLGLLEAHLKTTPDAELKRTMLGYLKRAEWLKSQLASNGLKDRLQFPYISKPG